MTRTRPMYVSSLTQGSADGGYLILRDGTIAMIRVAQPHDYPALQIFADELSSESKRHRFFSESNPSPELIASLCDNSDPRSLLTLLVTRAWKGAHHIIAVGSYFGKEENTAEIALA